MRTSQIITILLAVLFGLTPALALAQTRHSYHYMHYVGTTSNAVAPSTPAPASVSVPITPTITSAVPAVSSFADQVEAEVLRLTNLQRVQYGLTPLMGDSALASIARLHSSDMLTHNYFSHTDLAGCDGACRMTAAGYSWQAMGENIHAMWGYQLSAVDTANKIVTDWMNSTGHRANILNAQFTHAGIGIAVQGTTIYTTADYALPR